jgi:glycosyltransferase involved in cell wall biosynthesis
VLTVLLATRNRAQSLREVLQSYCAVHAPLSGWKLVVIDNGSTDQTPEVIATFTDRLPLHSFREPKLGKNVALNAGLGLVEGDLVVLTDDDAFPAPDWLVQMRYAADQQPAYSMFGGVVVPRWEVSPPSWIRWVNVGPVYTVTDSSLCEGPIEPHHIFGPNMAVRNSVFQAGTRFDAAIGPSGSSYAMGSETELVLRLGRQGYKAWHVKSAIVEHHIRKEQLEKAWVMQRGIRFGRGQYRLYGRDGNTDALACGGIPLRLVRKAVKQAGLAALAWISLRNESQFRACWRFNVFRGEIEEARKLDLERRARSSAHNRTAAEETPRSL